MKTPLTNDFAVVRRNKKKGTFHYRFISGEGINFYYSFKLIQKNRRRGKLQSLQFFLIENKRAVTVIIYWQMVSLGNFKQVAESTDSILTSKQRTTMSCC